MTTSNWINDRRPGPLDAVDGLVLMLGNGCFNSATREIATPWQTVAQSSDQWRPIPTVADVSEPACVDAIKISREQALYLTWAIEKLPKCVTKDLPESRQKDLYNLYETLHLFADAPYHAAA